VSWLKKKMSFREGLEKRGRGGGGEWAIDLGSKKGRLM